MQLYGLLIEYSDGGGTIPEEGEGSAARRPVGLDGEPCEFISTGEEKVRASF